MHRWASRTLCAIWLCAVSGVASAADDDGEDAREDIRGDNRATLSLRKEDLRFERPKGALGGNIASWTGFGLAMTGAVLAPVSAPLENSYNFRGEWWEKAAYDRAFLRRAAAAPRMRIAAAVLGGTGIITMNIGVLAEGRALKQVAPLSLAPGWVSLGFLSLAVTAGSLGGFGPFFLGDRGHGSWNEFDPVCGSARHEPDGETKARPRCPPGSLPT